MSDEARYCSGCREVHYEEVCPFCGCESPTLGEVADSWVDRRGLQRNTDDPRWREFWEGVDRSAKNAPRLSWTARTGDAG